jgi:hypothetical protein
MQKFSIKKDKEISDQKRSFNKFGVEKRILQEK